MKPGTDYLPDPTLPTVISSQSRPVHNHHRVDDQGNPAGGCSHGVGITIHWQDGPTKEAGGRNGAFVEEVVEAVISRLLAFQAGRYAHVANDHAIEYLTAANHVLRERTKDRIERGVEGRHLA